MFAPVKMIDRVTNGGLKAGTIALNIAQLVYIL